MGKRLGIDLGTTYSCISYVDESGQVQFVESSDGNSQLTPSIVFFDPNGEVVVGSTARQEGAMNPECLVERVKNHMGNPDYSVNMNGTDYSATAVSNLILRKLINDAEIWLGGEEIEGVVITCPAYFGDNARAATRAAGEQVILSNGQNLKVFSILDEPTAAAIAYGSTITEDVEKKVLIYDLGGGTFDCTIMQFKVLNGNSEMRVLATDGNHQLGGKDWDAALTNFVANRFCDATGDDVSEMLNDPDMRSWFSENIEKAKQTLSKKDMTALTPNFNGNKEKIEITREDFDNETAILLEQTTSLIDKMLAENSMTINDIDEIILVGGSTRMPQVTKLLEATYAKPLISFDPDKAVSKGAALVAKDYVESGEVPTFGGFDEPTTPTDAPANEATKLFTLDGREKIVYSICTKSYAIRFYNAGKPVFANLIKKGDPKPTANDMRSLPGFENGIQLSSGNEMIDSVDILIVENNEMVDVVDDEGLVELIFVEEPIQFEGQLRADTMMSVNMIVDKDGVLTVEIFDLENNKTYTLKPRRLGDEANDCSNVNKITLR